MESTVNHSVIESNLRKGNALYIGGIGYGSQTSKSRHAFALYGWVDNENQAEVNLIEFTMYGTLGGTIQ
ncbi:hypothetical protein GQR36_27605 [Enterococcus termitis]